MAGPRKVKFVEGGPELAAEYESAVAGSWSARGGEAERFGTAAYAARFDAPPAGTCLIDLGAAAQSAPVWVNGAAAGTAWIAPFRVVAEGVKVQDNLLEVEVTSTAANRARDLDRRKVAWKNFYDINFVNMDYKPFDASAWPVADARLLGPVTLRKLTSAAVQGGARKAGGGRKTAR